uniref:Phospholipase B-like n=1 Tax=Ditylenchus dipsaci TaxID=166011 RepID=A0A915DQ87_9BILA
MGKKGLGCERKVQLKFPVMLMLKEILGFLFNSAEQYYKPKVNVLEHRAAIETTVSVFNRSLLDEIKPVGQLHCWVRAIAANQLARTGREWCQLFKRYNSGTYNNQWIILDYNQFKPKQSLPDYGLLYVLEQMPAISGFDQKAKEMYWFSWFNCPRAKIFGRDHSKVVDLDSLTKLMRYNDYTTKSSANVIASPIHSGSAISARGDLNPANGTYPMPGMGHGTNYKLFKELKFRAWSGPTYDNVPVFKWSTTDLAKTVSILVIQMNGHLSHWNTKEMQRKANDKTTWCYHFMKMDNRTKAQCKACTKSMVQDEHASTALEYRL